MLRWPTRRPSLLASGVDGIVIAAATDAHRRADPGRRRCRDSGVLREAVVGRHCAGAAIARYVNETGFRCRSATRAVSTRHSRRPGGGGGRRARLGAHGAVDHPGSRPAPRGYIEVSGGIFRDCSVHDFDTVRWVTGQEVVEVYATGSARGCRLLRRVRRRRDRDQRCSPSTTERPRWCPIPVTTPAATTSDWKCTGPTTASPPGGATARRCAISNPAPAGRPARRRRSSWTGSPVPSTMNCRLHRTGCGQRMSPCTVDDAMAVAFIAEAATLSLQQHRPVQIEEVRQS